MTDFLFSLSRLRKRVVAALIFVAVATAAAAAEKSLPVPRFVTLKSDQVNVRTGPGERGNTIRPARCPAGPRT